MSMISDLDQLVRASSEANCGSDGNIWIDTATKTFMLRAFGDLVDDNATSGGIEGQALYSAFKEYWKNDNNLFKFAFPASMIDADAGKLIFGFDGSLYNGWKPADDTTRKFIRNAGWDEYSADGSLARRYHGVVTIGSVADIDQLYYQRVNDGSSYDFTYTGAVNEGVLVYADATNGDFDEQSYLAVFCREQGKTYSLSTTTQLGEDKTGARKISYIANSSADSKITADDTTVDTYGVTVTLLTVPAPIDIGGTDYPFSMKIDGNDKTKEQIYSAVQSLLRKDENINENSTNTGEIIGKTYKELCKFEGDTLVTSQGVYISNFNAADINSLKFVDNNGLEAIYPFFAGGSINFSATLQSDASAVYTMYYTSNYGTDTAEIVTDVDGNPITGLVSGNTSISFTYDYDGDTSDGGSGIDKDITIVAIGLDTAQFTTLEGTIKRSNANSFTVQSALERNYNNPS